MDSDRKQEDILRLNALVDGELAPAERAELAARLVVERDLARGYATLARLKAVTGEDADDTPEFSVPSPRRRAWPRLAAGGAALAAMLAIALFAASEFNGGDAGAPNEAPTAITLASLPAGTTIPQLDTAGLKLVSLAIDPGHVPIFAATYRGPHGCRLDLRAWPMGTAPPPLEGTGRYRWTVGDLNYELVAHGMPAWRFDIIAHASELQTRLNADHNGINRRLRQAEYGAPPCAG